MQKITKKVIKTGNSATIVLDKKITFASDIDIGDYVDISCENNKIIIEKSKKLKISQI